MEEKERKMLILRVPKEDGEYIFINMDKIKAFDADIDGLCRVLFDDHSPVMKLLWKPEEFYYAILEKQKYRLRSFG